MNKRMRNYEVDMDTMEHKDFGVVPIEEEIFNEDETEESPAEVEATGPETKNGTVANSLTVKLRRGPSLKHDTLEVLNKGDKVTILDKVDNFYKVSVNNRIGYILSDFVKEE